MSAIAIDSFATEELVLQWRCERLVAAGYPTEDAVYLATRSDVDLHQATGLLRNGCPVETALQILV